MTIAIFNAHLQHGGVERQIEYLVRELVQRGHGVYVFAIADAPIDYPADVTTLRWPGLFRRGLTKFVGLPAVVRSLRVEMGSHEPDVLLTWGPYENLAASLVARRLQVPHVASVRTNRSWAFKFVSLWGKSEGIVINAQDVARRLECDHGVSPEKIHLIRNALDVAQYPFLPAVGTDGDRLRLTVIGRLSTSKNQLLLLRALPELSRRHPEREIALRLVGSAEQTPYRAEIERAIAANDLSAHVSIEPYATDVQSVYRQTDLLILPSISEGLPNVLLEAMATGTPWIASDIADNRWLAGELHERGLVFESNSSDSLIATIDEFLRHDEAELSRRLRAARRFVEETFSVERAATAYLDLFSTLIS